MGQNFYSSLIMKGVLVCVSPFINHILGKGYPFFHSYQHLKEELLLNCCHITCLLNHFNFNMQSPQVNRPRCWQKIEFKSFSFNICQVLHQTCHITIILTPLNFIRYAFRTFIYFHQRKGQYSIQKNYDAIFTRFCRVRTRIRVLNG